MNFIDAKNLAIKFIGSKIVNQLILFLHLLILEIHHNLNLYFLNEAILVSPFHIDWPKNRKFP